MFGFGKKKTNKIGQESNNENNTSNLSQKSVELVGVIHNQAELDKFMLEYPQKFASEGYTELAGNKVAHDVVGNLLYPEFSKFRHSIGAGAIGTGEIYEYTHPPYKLLVSRGELGIMWGFIKNIDM